jgi:ADP-ribosylation factor-like protein 4
VDSTDFKRLDEAKVELEEVLNIKDSHNTPLLILANKQDLKSSVSTIELAQKLELDSLESWVNWHMHPTSGRHGDGLQESMLHFAAMIRHTRKIGARNRKMGEKKNRGKLGGVVGGGGERDWGENGGFSSTKYSKFV